MEKREKFETVLESVINHVKCGDPLLEGIVIVEIRNIEDEIKVMTEATKNELRAKGANEELAYYHTFMEIGNLIPKPYNNFILENTAEEGVVSLP